MAPKFKAYLKEMYDAHKELFDDFEEIHAKYTLEKSKWQHEFNEEGKSVIRVVEEWENKLCTRMEKGKHSGFSHRLADKFRAELRVRFPMIDFIGVTVKKSTPDFEIPRINFS
jgi:hypothetical protein